MNTETKQRLAVVAVLVAGLATFLVLTGVFVGSAWEDLVSAGPLTPAL